MYRKWREVRFLMIEWGNIRLLCSFGICVLGILNEISKFQCWIDSHIKTSLFILSESVWK